MTIFPVPIEMLSAFFRKPGDPVAAPTPAAAELPPATTPSALPATSPADALPQMRIEPVKTPVRG